METETGDPLLRCTFCLRSEEEVNRLIAGPLRADSVICDGCVELCSEILIQDEVRRRLPGTIDKLEADNELLRARIGTLEHQVNKLRAQANLLKTAISPFSRQLLSSEPDFHKTRIFSLEDYDKQILAARAVLRIKTEPDTLEELTRINEELGLYDE